MPQCCMELLRAVPIAVQMTEWSRTGFDVHVTVRGGKLLSVDHGQIRRRCDGVGLGLRQLNWLRTAAYVTRQQRRSELEDPTRVQPVTNQQGVRARAHRHIRVRADIIGHARINM